MALATSVLKAIARAVGRGQLSEAAAAKVLTVGGKLGADEIKALLGSVGKGAVRNAKTRVGSYAEALRATRTADATAGTPRRFFVAPSESNMKFPPLKRNLSAPREAYFHAAPDNPGMEALLGSFREGVEARFASPPSAPIAGAPAATPGRFGKYFPAIAAGGVGFFGGRISKPGGAKGKEKSDLLQSILDSGRESSERKQLLKAQAELANIEAQIKMVKLMQAADEYRSGRKPNVNTLI